MSRTELPRWDMSVYFPAIDSREFTAAHEGFGAAVARLTALYDEHDVGAGAGAGAVEAEARAEAGCGRLEQ